MMRFLMQGKSELLLRETFFGLALGCDYAIMEPSIELGPASGEVIHVRSKGIRQEESLW